ncbi:MAG: hypothetical protein LBE35_04085 [Clostridiales bacterium]|jgi:hypothetical protein|nr:hypothetical protein [Clostridiales bacterium]
MAIERELKGIYSRQYYELLIIEYQTIKMGNELAPQLANSIHAARTQLTKEEIAMVREEVAAYIATTS